MEKYNWTAFIYARRSSQKNKSNSISVIKQIEELENGCNEKWLKIIWVYTDNKSWFIEWKRDEFNEMLDEINKRNLLWKWERVDFLYVYMTSRLCRNRVESNKIIPLIEDDEIEIISRNESYSPWLAWKKALIDDLNKAIYESKEKSEQWKINMDTYIREKWKIPTSPRYWYILDWRWDNTELLHENTHWEKDLVIQAFKLYSTWEYTYKSLAEALNKKWYSKYVKIKWTNEYKYRDITDKDIENFLIKEFYCWDVIVTYSGLKKSEIKYFKEKYPNHEIINNTITIDYSDIVREKKWYIPLISKGLFKRCEDVRLWKWSKSKEDWKHTYIYKWVLKCSCKSCITNNPLEFRSFTWEHKIKKSWKEYDYYRCTNNNNLEVKCDNTNITELELNEIINENFLKKLYFSKTEILIFKEIKEKELEEQWDIKKNEVKRLKDKLNSKIKEKDKLYERYKQEDDEYFRNELKNDIKNLNYEIEELKKEVDEIPEEVKEKWKELKRYIDIINEIANNFDNLDRKKRKNIIRNMFNYIVIKNKEVIDYSLTPLFDIAFNKKRVLTLSQNDNQKNEAGYNSDNGLNKTKRIQSNDYILDGTPTRSRTLPTGFGILDSNR